MGSEFFKHPAKRLDREFRGMGAKRVGRTSLVVTYRFPDGARRDVPTNIGPANARSMLNALQRIYGAHSHDPLGDAVKRPGAPTIDIERMVASDHAKVRLTLMNHQAGLEIAELLHALRIPTRVLWSEWHQSWLWVGERIAVTTFVDDTGFATIGTILWTDQAMWDANPRPEKVRA